MAPPTASRATPVAVPLPYARCAASDADSSGVECTDVTFSHSGTYLASCHRNGRTVILRTALFSKRLVLTPAAAYRAPALLSEAPQLPSGRGVGKLLHVPATALRVRVWDVAPPAAGASGGSGGHADDPTATPAAYLMMTDGADNVGLYHVRRRPQQSHMAAVAQGEQPVSHYEALRAGLQVRMGVGRVWVRWRRREGGGQ